jgi:inosine-uridine nucleoside N-ribohydrolase
VIIDTDIGDDIDDAFALALALTDRRLEVVGVTTAFGDTRTRVLLMRRLLSALGRSNVPVAQGPVTPDPTPFTQRRWAMGAADTSPAPDAIDFIRAEAARRPGEITLIELAPMTNLAALMARYPAALGQLKQVALMGGSIHVGYAHGGAIPNPQPSAEYNVAQAPQALAAVLRSGVPVRMFPLDSTELAFDEVDRERLFAHGSPASDALTLLYQQWRLWNAWGQITPTLFDVVPVAWLLDPSLCAPQALHVEVDAQGYTRPTNGTPNAQVCLRLYREAALDLVLDDLAPEGAENGDR